MFEIVIIVQLLLKLAIKAGNKLVDDFGLLLTQKQKKKRFSFDHVPLFFSSLFATTNKTKTINFKLPPKITEIKNEMQYKNGRNRRNPESYEK